MTRFVLRRLLRAVLTAWLVVTVTFVVLRVTGDPVLALVPVDYTSPEVIERYRQLWGLDRPLWVQYLAYMRGLAEGVFGRSFTDGRDAWEVVAERIPNTVLLMSVAFVAMLALGLPLGLLAALNRGTWIDRAVMALAVAGHSLPGYLLGILMIWLFAVELRWLPSSGHGTAAHMVMPVVTLAVYLGAAVARFTRAAVLEVLGQPHVRAAVAQGWPWWAVVRRDVLPNAAIPLVTVLGMILGGLIGGAIITEWIFAWPGIGRLLIDAVANRDLAVVQTLVLLFSASMILANLAVDLSYAVLNPKIRMVRRGSDHG
jgi:peptide/nickel transport system permease protein